MRVRNLLKRKLDVFYKETTSRRNKDSGMSLRIQTDQEMYPNETKKLNKKYDVDLFDSFTNGGKTYAAKQKKIGFYIILKIKFKTKIFKNS